MQFNAISFRAFIWQPSECLSILKTAKVKSQIQNVDNSRIFVCTFQTLVSFIWQTSLNTTSSKIKVKFVFQVLESTANCFLWFIFHPIQVSLHFRNKKQKKDYSFLSFIKSIIFNVDFTID